jgi:bacterioferritin-associated ferredoxin
MGIVIIQILCYSGFDVLPSMSWGPSAHVGWEVCVYVCICNQVSDREIHGAVRLGVSTLEELADTLGVGTCCGRCRECAQNVLEDGLAAAALQPVTLIAKGASLTSYAPTGSRAIMHAEGPLVANDQNSELTA